MRRIAIIGIWFVVLIGDGIVFPALTGFPSGFGIMVFLSALAITFGIHRWVIGLGIVLAGIAELMMGTHFGTIIGAWLAMALSWYLLNRFLNMKSISEGDSFVAILPFTFFSFGLFSFGELMLWTANRFVYEPGLAITILVYIFHSPIIISVILIELAVTLLIFRFIFSPRNSIYV